MAIGSENFQKAMAAKTRTGLDAEVIYENIPVGSMEGYTDSASDMAPVSNLAQVNDFESQNTRYATLEDGRWLLDGSYEYLDDEDVQQGQIGYWSSMLCDSAGIFATAPQYTRQLSKAYSVAGFFLSFDPDGGECAEDFTLTLYNQQTQVVQYKITGNQETRLLLERPSNNFDRVVVTLQKWSRGYRRARITEFTVGIARIFGAAELVDPNYVRVLREIDPTSDTLPESTVRFSVDNRDKKYDMLNPTGIWPYIGQRQKVRVKMGLKNEKLPVGIYYLAEWQGEDGRVRFEARDVISFLDTPFPDTYYNGTTLQRIALDALAKAGVQDYTLDASLADIAVKGNVANVTCRDVIRYTAMAAGLMCMTDRTTGAFLMLPVPAVSSGITLAYNVIPEPKTPLNKAVSTITLFYYTWSSATNYQRTQVDISTGVENGETLTLPDNPFINTLAMAQVIGERRKQALLERLGASITWRQNPALDVGERINVQIPFGILQGTLITRQELFYNGGISGSAETKGGTA